MCIIISASLHRILIAFTGNMNEMLMQLHNANMHMHRNTCTAFSIASGYNVQNRFVFLLLRHLLFDMFVKFCIFECSVLFCQQTTNTNEEYRKKEITKKLVIMMSKMAECKWWIFFHPRKKVMPNRKLLFVSRKFHVHITKKYVENVSNVFAMLSHYNWKWKWINLSGEHVFFDAMRIRRVLWLHIASEFSYLALIS